VVGLYLDPPERAVVFSVDAKTQIQALDRTQPGLPLKKGRAGTMTHGYKRHGTTTLFAALNVASGEIVAECAPRQRHQEFLRFARMVRRVEPELEIRDFIVPPVVVYAAADREYTGERPLGCPADCLQRTNGNGQGTRPIAALTGVTRDPLWMPSRWAVLRTESPSTMQAQKAGQSDWYFDQLGGVPVRSLKVRRHASALHR
jgi:hypothetical protein